MRALLRGLSDPYLHIILIGIIFAGPSLKAKPEPPPIDDKQMPRYCYGCRVWHSRCQPCSDMTLRTAQTSIRR